jgi:hypothetical protein
MREKYLVYTSRVSQGGRQPALLRSLLRINRNLDLIVGTHCSETMTLDYISATIA